VKSEKTNPTSVMSPAKAAATGITVDKTVRKEKKSIMLSQLCVLLTATGKKSIGESE
jgi:hypothetical protein